MEYTRVAAITPMFSAYVVVGEPPTADAITVQRPSAAIARPITGSRSWPVISATALTCPVFSAISAITAGSTRSVNVRLKEGAWMPVIPCARSLRGGKPNQSAAWTPAQLSRSWVPTLPAPSAAVIGPKTVSKTQDTR